MAKPEYTAGLHFIVTTPAQTLDKTDRKVIRGHATRAGVSGRRNFSLRSWISPNRELGTPATIREASTSNPILLLPSPRRVGGYFSGLQLPLGVEPDMISDLVKLIDLRKNGVYPYDICLNVHVVERGWFPYMMSDICCLHSMLFSVRAFLESAPLDQLSKSAYYHYGRTLQILQARLNGSDHRPAISDATIMAIITLAQAAELTGDFAAVASHVRGLMKIVSLRGGVQALNTHNNLQVKVCRADLAYALLSRNQPYLYRERLSWDCFIANRGLIQCTHQPHEAHLCAFAEMSVDIRLYNILKDLHTFSCLSNLAYQTTRKFSPEMYNEMTTSILYRLSHLSFERDPLQEALRGGLLAFASTIFLQRQLMEQSNRYILDSFNTALSGLKATDVVLPVSIRLWLTMLSQLVAHKEPSHEDWTQVWLDETVNCACINSWSEAREMLKSIAWVGFIHDRLGEEIFDSSILRLAEPPQADA